MSRDIIIPGAGASRAEGAPMQSELIKEFFSLYGQDEYRKKWYDNIFSFFKNFFGIKYDETINSIEFPTFEEVLGLVELAINRKEYFGDHIKTPQSLLALRKHLIFLISQVLKDSLWRHGRHHRNLIQRLVDENLLEKTSFISLNYDIIIDNSILQLRHLDINSHYEIDYGVDFVKDDETDELDMIKKKIELFKLHGSLNWLYCHSCLSLKLTEQRKGATVIADRHIQCINNNCSANYQPIIIPPTFFKVMSNYFITQIWHKTELALREAKRIFFCGYSFPDADIHIKYLLKRAELYRKQTPEIYIINWYKGKSHISSEEENNRFFRFFKEKNRIHYTELSFEDFSLNGIKKM